MDPFGTFWYFMDCFLSDRIRISMGRVMGDKRGKYVYRRPHGKRCDVLESKMERGGGEERKRERE